MLRLVIAPILAIGAAGPAAPSLDWIGGHWCTEAGGEIVEEFWLPPHGGVALGLSRTRTADRAAAFEFLRIVDIHGTPVYVAQPGGRPPTAFRSTAGGDRWIRFENRDHDFPQRIEYRREGDRLYAEIAGAGEDGAEMVIAFDYRRCGDAPQTATQLPLRAATPILSQRKAGGFFASGSR